MISIDEAQAVVATPLRGHDGTKLGTVAEVLVDAETGMPTWFVVATGTAGERQRYVPAADATFDRPLLHVPYSKDAFLNAPDVDVGGSQLAPEDAAALDRYYREATVIESANENADDRGR